MPVVSKSLSVPKPATKSRISSLPRGSKSRMQGRTGAADAPRGMTTSPSAEMASASVFAPALACASAIASRAIAQTSSASSSYPLSPTRMRS